MTLGGGQEGTKRVSGREINEGSPDNWGRGSVWDKDKSSPTLKQPRKAVGGTVNGGSKNNGLGQKTQQGGRIGEDLGHGTQFGNTIGDYDSEDWYKHYYQGLIMLLSVKRGSIRR